MPETKQEQQFVVAETTPPATTPAEAWGAADLYRLPSGNIARLRRPALLVMAVNGLISNPYLKRFLTGRDTALTDEERWRTYEENARGFLACAELCLVEPRLAVDRPPEKGEIRPEQLSDADLQWLYFAFAQGGAEQAAPFRVESQPQSPARAR
jgi:hypothetical protein